MGEAYLDWQKKSAGIKLNDVIEEFKYVAPYKSVKKGDLLTYVEEYVEPAIEPPFNAVALSDGEGGIEYIEENEVTKTDNAFTATWTEESKTKIIGNNGMIVTTNKSPLSGSLAQIFDGKTNTNFDSQNQWSSTAYINIELPEPLKISKMKTYMMNSNRLSSDDEKKFDITILGSKDGASWTELYRVNGFGHSQLTEISLSNVDYYKHYRISTTFGSDAMALIVYEWQTSEYIEKEVIQ